MFFFDMIVRECMVLRISEHVNGFEGKKKAFNAFRNGEMNVSILPRSPFSIHESFTP